MNVIESVDRYEGWLKQQLKRDLRKKDLKKKHKKMAKDAFQFLRATYWRWAETIYDVEPDLRRGPEVLAVGDIHVENFGTWRDGEGRLIWGVNDFDEAAKMPYGLDIVRLATSAVLAGVKGITAAAICNSIREGYREGLADPRPFVLDREHPELRRDFVVSDDERIDFWTKFNPAELKKNPNKDIEPIDPEELPSRFERVLKRARPDRGVAFEYFLRVAGTGSLGRPRAFGSGEWQGDLIVREAKAMVRSAWALAHHGSHNSRCDEIAAGRYRSPDPTYRLRGRVLVRRLSPNDFKIEAKQKEGKKTEPQQENPKARERKEIVNAHVLHAMGRDLAAIHCGTQGRDELGDDLKRRKSGWLLAASEAAAEAARVEFEEWKAYHDALPETDG
jgi:uncharacterized protein (DUF2252 family)